MANEMTTEMQKQWDSPESKRLRALDAQRLSLDQRVRNQDAAEAVAKAAREAEIELAKPATAEEAATLENLRIVQHVDSIIGGPGADITQVAPEVFAHALNKHHVDWVDGRATADHLRDLRLNGAPEPVAIEPDEPLNDTGLHRLLAIGRKI
jgi:hypothetical protein